MDYSMIPAPPPPQKKSTTISSSCWLKPRPYWVLKSKGYFFCYADIEDPRQGGVTNKSGVLVKHRASDPDGGSVWLGS